MTPTTRQQQAEILDALAEWLNERVVYHTLLPFWVTADSATLDALHAGAALLRGERVQVTDQDGAGLIGQPIPDVVETEPRLNKCVVCSQDIISCAGEVCDPCATGIALTPIEFAPLDGTPLLLFSDDFGKHLLGYGRYMRFDDGSEGWIASSFHCYNGEVWSVMSRPTHFMRLPRNPVRSAPSSVGEASGGPEQE